MDKTVRLLSTLAFMGAIRRLAEPYGAATGTRIEADFAPTLALLKRLRGGEEADVLILTREGMDELVADGSVATESKVDLACSYVGLAVKAGDPHPDISSETALRATLLGARSVAYSRLGASGIFFVDMIGRMGIAEAVNAGATIVPAGFTAERLVTGEADIAIQQVSELKLVSGVEVVGPLPRELQMPAPFSGGRLAASGRAAEADRLLRYLASSEVAPVLRESGLEP
jgi:molybdate transport system substrate-binding protein